MEAAKYDCIIRYRKQSSGQGVFTLKLNLDNFTMSSFD